LTDELARGVEVRVGRLGPVFEVPGSGVRGKLDNDKYVSRAQVGIRWNRRRCQFSVRPLGQKLVQVYGPDGELFDEAGIPPGSQIALGQRVLLLLTCSQYSPFDEQFGLLGNSDSASRLRQKLRNVAAFDSTILISGEPGSGKELVARAIHSQSSRRDAPYVPINCANFQPGLADSILFGHERGAFSGATETRKGIFETAAGGTVFLDEIHRLSPEVQPKLLRILASGGDFTRLGGSTQLKNASRVLVATNVDLRAEVQQGRFQADLLSRLTRVQVEVPPLRNRKTDSAQIFCHFLRTFCEGRPELGHLFELGVERTPFIPLSFFRKLLQGNWRDGNVRALSGLADSVAIENLDVDRFVDPRPQTDSSLAGEASAEPDIFELLVSHDFNVSALARSMGMSRGTLYKQLERAGIKTSKSIAQEELLAAVAAVGRDPMLLARHLRVTALQNIKQQLREFD
jgi:DNA-binding NtrC family response regulator